MSTDAAYQSSDVARSLSPPLLQILLILSLKKKGQKEAENDANGNGFSFHSLHRVKFLRTFKTAFKRMY